MKFAKFSIRTMLVIITFIAVLLGVFGNQYVNKRRLAKRRIEAIRLLHKRGAQICIFDRAGRLISSNANEPVADEVLEDSNTSFSARFESKPLDLITCLNGIGVIRGIRCSSDELTDNELAQCLSFMRLKSLVFVSENKVWLESFPVTPSNLQEFFAPRVMVSPLVASELIKSDSLNRLAVDATCLSPLQQSHLFAIPSLRSIQLYNGKLSAEGGDRGRVENVQLYKCKIGSGNSGDLQKLVERAVSMSLIDCEFERQGLRSFGSPPYLTSLSLDQCEISGSDMQWIMEKMQLRKVFIGPEVSLISSQIRSFSNNPHLEIDCEGSPAMRDELRRLFPRAAISE